MISYRIPTNQLESLEGKIIFHAEKGSDVFTAILPQLHPRRIGGKLGTVTRITGPNRIFYTVADGTEKYVSHSGIGYVCETDNEAQQLEQLRDEAAKKVREFATSIYAELQSRLDKL